MAKPEPKQEGKPGDEQRERSGGRKVNPKAEQSARKPDSGTVADFHENSDVDAHAQAMHHTLGFAPGQASPGDHSHDNNSPDSLPLWRGVALVDPGASATASELAAAISALNALIRQKSVS